MSIRMLVGLSLLLGAGTAVSRSETVIVHVFDFDFSANPAGDPIVDPTIQLGDTIRWVWDSGFHSVTSVGGIPEMFDSGVHPPPFTFEHTFTNFGSWQYYCTPHGFDFGDGTARGMAGTINVIPEPSTVVSLGAIALIAAMRRRG